jgi:hypothetical protein
LVSGKDTLCIEHQTRFDIILLLNPWLSPTQLQAKDVVRDLSFSIGFDYTSFHRSMTIQEVNMKPRRGMVHTRPVAPCQLFIASDKRKITKGVTGKRCCRRS